MDYLRDKINAILHHLFGWGATPTSTSSRSKPLSVSEILCDSCKYNYGNVCVRPERPNATSCPEYKQRG